MNVRLHDLISTGKTEIDEKYIQTKKHELVGTLIIPDHITHINRSAFEGCEGLEKVVFPDNLRSIRAHAFANCKKLRRVVFPSKYFFIDQQVFYNCHKKLEIIFAGGTNSLEDMIANLQCHLSGAPRTCTMIVEWTKNHQIPNTGSPNYIYKLTYRAIGELHQLNEDLLSHSHYMSITHSRSETFLAKGLPEISDDEFPIYTLRDDRFQIKISGNANRITKEQATNKHLDFFKIKATDSLKEKSLNDLAKDQYDELKTGDWHLNTHLMPEERFTNREDKRNGILTVEDFWSMITNNSLDPLGDDATKNLTLIWGRAQDLGGGGIKQKNIKRKKSSIQKKKKKSKSKTSKKGKKGKHTKKKRK